MSTPTEQAAPKRRKKVVKKAEPPTGQDGKAAAPNGDAQTTKGPAGAQPAAPRSLADTAGAGAGVTPMDIAAKLKAEGAGTCAESIDAAAAPSMVGVTQSNTLSAFSNTQPRDKHAVSVFIAQRYGANAAVPFGATGIVASPGPTGGCDATIVQIVSSPLPCGSVRSSIGNKSKAYDLAGLTLMQNGAEQTLLMPTGTNTCVVIGFKSTFAQ